MASLEGKVTVVTGGGSGIGLGIAERFAAAGAHVVVAGRTKAKLDEAVAKLGAAARGIVCDVGDEEQVRALFRDLDTVDHLVTCAGGAVFGAIDELPLQAWKKLFDGRFFGQIACCQHAVPKMVEGSSIILCSGVAGRVGMVDYAGGSALCGAVNAMGRSLAVELAPRNIRVNVISPGFIFGTTIEMNLEGQKLADFVNGTMARIPLGRAGFPPDMAEAAYFLAISDYMSGQVIDVDGGWTAS